MNTRLTHKLMPALLSALAVVMTFFSARAESAEAVSDKVAVRPDATANWNTGTGTYNVNAPYGDYSQPLPQPGYNTQPNGWLGNQPNTNTWCPTGVCPPGTNGSDFSGYGNVPTYPTQPNGGFNWQTNYGDSWNNTINQRYPQDRYRDQPNVPNYPYPPTQPNYPNTPVPGYGYPNLPNSNFPNSPYPNPTYPNNQWPNGPVFNGQYPVNPYPNVPTQPHLVNEPDLNTKITARYQNPDMLGFLSKTNVNQTMNLYMEASRLIDSRHVDPASYEVRTKKALENLSLALNNSTFLRAAGATGDANQVRTLQQELAQLAQSNPARTANEAIGVMQYAGELANRRLGVRREAVALEFLNGTLDSLDTYTAFLPSKQVYGSTSSLENMTAALEENIVGVGVELKADERGALVLGTVDNGPAARARLTRGDIITGIDGRSVAGMSLNQIADMISGTAGSTLTVRILRNGQDYTASMRRERVYVSSVAGAQMLNNETGYLRLKQFSESSAEDLEKAMLSMYQNGMKSLVLDLRGNPGGLLTESIEVSDLFLPSGRIVATKGRTAEDNMDERAKFEKTWKIPLVVLVDGDSASASEIFAAAIQENRRGVIVGRQTYGKGTVQTHFPLQTVSGTLKMTTAKFYSPTGREMAGAGVRPDVPVNAGNTDLYTGNLSQDPDVQTALQVIGQGYAAQLANSPSNNSTAPQLRN